ncbi:MAG: hypothetical protein JW959_10790 [Pirellulales bacterium]|nr:hypothetical protein [Pirellulales bacterium]
MNGREWLTAAELGGRHGISRGQMEVLLDKLGLRHEGDDGTTLYAADEVEQKLDERDAQIMQSVAEVLDYVEDAELAAEVLHAAFTEMRLSWLQSRATGDVVDILRRQLASRLPSLHAIQRAQSGSGGPTVPEILRDFERTIVAALHERRQQPAVGQAKPLDASKQEA